MTKARMRIADFKEWSVVVMSLGFMVCLFLFFVLLRKYWLTT